VSCSSRGERPTPFAADSGFAAEGTRREPAKVLVGEGALPAPPLPLKPTVGRPAVQLTGGQKWTRQPVIRLRGLPFC